MRSFLLYFNLNLYINLQLLERRGWTMNYNGVNTDSTVWFKRAIPVKSDEDTGFKKQL